MNDMRIGNFIDGAWHEAQSGTWFEVEDPTHGNVVAWAARSGARDAAYVTEVAQLAFRTRVWCGKSERDRASILFEVARLMREQRDALAQLETLDSGKPYSDALADVDESAYLFEYYAGWVTKVGGEIPPVGPKAASFVFREPVGVVCCITPWNYPLLMAAQKVAPALAAGCSVIVKPAEQTPLTTARLVDIAHQAGVPRGVFNLVNGYGAEIGEALVASPLVDMVSFTGSLEVGRHIQQVAAHTVKRVTLELGGKSPNIIFGDADLARAIPGTCFGVFWNQGEVCSAGSRVFVHRSRWDEFLAGVTDYVAELRVGDPMDPATRMGPLISRVPHAALRPATCAHENGSFLPVRRGVS